MDLTIYEDTSANQIKGQLSFIEEQKPQMEYITYVIPCGGCICNKCANDVNGRYTPGEMEEPCFNCEECREYDGDYRNKSCNKKTECESFKMTNYHAALNRKNIKLLR